MDRTLLTLTLELDRLDEALTLSTVAAALAREGVLRPGDKARVGGGEEVLVVASDRAHGANEYVNLVKSEEVFIGRD